MIRIGIVEDKKGICENLVAYLQTDPDLCCVCTCATAEEALEVIPREQPEVVLMDIQLPNQSGIECTGRLKQLLPDLKIIMVTVYGDPDLIFNALRAGACGYLLKRCTPEQLVSAVREVREGGAPMSREIARKLIAFFQDSGKPATVDQKLEELSPREREILELVAEGWADKEIAQHIGIRHGTVRWHLQHVYDKLHVRSRTEAAMKLRASKPA